MRYSDVAGAELVATSSFVYDGNGNLLSITHKDALDATIAEYDYTYDESGRMTSQTDTQAEIDSGTPWVRNYTCDDLGQLLGDSNDTYDYDLGGNRDTGYTYYRNYADTADTNQLESDGTWTYTYDAEGNMTKKSQGAFAETWVYGYDHANHLILAEKLNQDPDVCGTPILLMEAEYKYDVYGNRVEKAVDDDGADVNPTVVTRFAIDGWNPTKPSPIGNENYDVFADLDYTNSLTTRYMRGDAVDQLLARIDGSDTRWHLTDHLGSVRDIIDNTGTSLDSLRYDSFGNIDTETASGYRGRYAFTGREFDVETQLQYNRARYYDAGTGRWISQDPMGFDAGDNNLYRYVHNAVVNQRDPSGLWEDDMHFWMTYYVARRMGLASIPVTFDGVVTDEAFLIAWSAVYVDYNTNTEPLPTTSELLASLATFSGLERGTKYHFPRQGPQTAGHTVQAGSLLGRLTLMQGILDGDPVLTGIGFHTMQDTYSHNGTKQAHVEGVNYAGHGVDLPFNNIGKAQETVSATISMMLSYIQRNHPQLNVPGIGTLNFANNLISKIGPLLNLNSWKQADDMELKNSPWLDFTGVHYNDERFVTGIEDRSRAWQNFVSKEFGGPIVAPIYKSLVPASKVAAFESRLGRVIDTFRAGRLTIELLEDGFKHKKLKLDPRDLLVAP